MGLRIVKPEGVPGSAAPAILVGLFVAFGGVLFGYVELDNLFLVVANMVKI
jgi:hypothetical protein